MHAKGSTLIAGTAKNAAQLEEQAVLREWD